MASHFLLPRRLMGLLLHAEFKCHYVRNTHMSTQLVHESNFGTNAISHFFFTIDDTDYKIVDLGMLKSQIYIKHFMGLSRKIYNRSRDKIYNAQKTRLVLVWYYIQSYFFVKNHPCLNVKSSWNDCRYVTDQFIMSF